MIEYEMNSSSDLMREVEKGGSSGCPVRSEAHKSGAIILDSLSQQSAEGAAVYSDDSSGFKQLPTTD